MGLLFKVLLKAQELSLFLLTDTDINSQVDYMFNPQQLSSAFLSASDFKSSFLQTVWTQIRLLL